MLRRSLRTRITTRVLTLSATAAVLLGATLVVLIIAVTGQRDAGRIAFRSQEALTLTNRLEATLVAIEHNLRAYVKNRRPSSLQTVTRELAAYPVQQRAVAELVSGDRVQRARVRQIGRRIEEYVSLGARPLLDLARVDPQAARNQLFYTANSERVIALGADLRALSRALADRESTLVGVRKHRAESQSALAIEVGFGGLALVLVIVVGSTSYLRRAVVRPVVRVAHATGQLAAGDLATRVPASREDEIGDLARGFNSMADSLERGQAELERSNAELTRSNAELEQFASVTSHDLQAPLTTISMYAELLQRRQASGADGADLIDGIRGATQQARALIGDLLEYSRAGRGDLHVEPLPCGLVVDQALEALAGAIEASGARVRVGSLPVVLADRSNLCRVFTNLVGNAVKFTRGDEPQVSIEAQADGAMWRVDVRDNGIGMDPANVRRIFEPFRRLHGEDDYEGTGIGLAVCERIVEQHGGRIWVSSVPGEGSVFSFTLPGAQLPGDAPDTATQVAHAAARA
jgi:signal transduction histidine kinase